MDVAFTVGIKNSSNLASASAFDVETARDGVCSRPPPWGCPLEDTLQCILVTFTWRCWGSLGSVASGWAVLPCLVAQPGSTPLRPALCSTASGLTVPPATAGALILTSHVSLPLAAPLTPLTGPVGQRLAEFTPVPPSPCPSAPSKAPSHSSPS